MFIVSISGYRPDAACGEDRHCTIQENSKNISRVFTAVYHRCHLRQYNIVRVMALEKLWQKADSTQRQNGDYSLADDVADISCFQSQDCIESHFTLAYT